MNQAQNKPPPPVRRSSSITTANPAVLQKLRNTPPRESPPIQQPGRPSSHRRTSSSGSQPEPAYAELQEIQESIQARQMRQGSHENVYASTAAHHSYNQQSVPNSQPNMYAHYNPPVGNAMMPPPSEPHYAQTGMQVYGQNRAHHGQPAGQVDMIRNLNQRFAAMNASLQNDEELPPPPPDIMCDSDLPPPPSAEELQEIESVYSNAPPPVYNKPKNNSTDFRASLVSELKSGPKLRRVNSKDNGSEC